MKKSLIFGLMTLFLSPLVYATDLDEMDNLDPYYEKPGLDIGQYTSVFIAPLSANDARVIPPPWVTGDEASPKQWKLTKKDVEWLRKSYQEAMRKEIGEVGGRKIVDQPVEGALIVRIELVSLMPFARKGEKAETLGFGVIVAQAQLRDGMTGELLAVYEGPQRVGTEYQQNTRLNAERKLENLFSIWGARVNKYLNIGVVN